MRGFMGRLCEWTIIKKIQYARVCWVIRNSFLVLFPFHFTWKWKSIPWYNGYIDRYICIIIIIQYLKWSIERIRLGDTNTAILIINGWISKVSHVRCVFNMQAVNGCKTCRRWWIGLEGGKGGYFSK